MEIVEAQIEERMNLSAACGIIFGLSIQFRTRVMAARAEDVMSKSQNATEETRFESKVAKRKPRMEGSKERTLSRLRALSGREVLRLTFLVMMEARWGLGNLFWMAG